MCGIVGVFDRHGGSVDERLVIRMRDAMVHRGPDDAGLWHNERGNLALGHRRLSIVDLSPDGRAPMANEDGTIQVTFNGEIYNHAELRAELEDRGHVFRSRCDTEVLVHMYEEYGPAMVERLFGMFAFGIWDQVRERLFLARDRLGIKPLYWLDQDARFAFGSEIKALLPVLKRRDLDPEAVAHYLSFVAVPPPRTMFEGVSKLAPAHTMIVDRDGPKEPQRYWDPIENRDDFSGTSVELEREIMRRLRKSIERRMMSDVPVGVFLSGGLDSSTNVALMSELIDEPVNTFSIGFEGVEEFNEFDWARKVAAIHKTNHHEVTIGHDDLWRFLPDLVYHQDEPIADPVCVPLYFVAKLAKDNGVTVVHVGEGADEIFSGYATYVQANQIATNQWPRLRSMPRPLRVAAAGAARMASPFLPDHEVHTEVVRRAAQRDADLWWGGAVAFYEHGLSRLTTPSFQGLAGTHAAADVVADIRRDGERAGARDELDSLIYQDLRLRLPELLLMRVDKLTMANAIEARVPFLDHELVELACAVPASEKIRDGIGKHVLKRAVSEVLPEEIVWRKKQGFGTPVSQWFRGPLGDQLDESLRTSAMNELGWIKPNEVERISDLHRSGRAERSFQLWNILNLYTWFDHWIAGQEPEHDPADHPLPAGV